MRTGDRVIEYQRGNGGDCMGAAEKKRTTKGSAKAKVGAKKTKTLSHRGAHLLEEAGLDAAQVRAGDAEEVVTEAVAELDVDLARHQVDALVSARNYVDDADFGAVVEAIADDNLAQVPELLAGAAPDDATDAIVDLWTGGNSQVLSPKLRMIANGDDEVNGYRALFASCVSSQNIMERADLERAVAEAPDEPADSIEESEAAQESDSASSSESATEADETGEDRGLKIAKQATISCFVHRLGAEGRRGRSGTPDGTIVVEDLTLAEIENIRHGRSDDIDLGAGPLGPVAYVETGSPLAPPKPRLGGLLNQSKAGRLVAPNGEPPQVSEAGPNVIVGIIDVGGFDFSHADFLVTRHGRKSTKFLAIWDQGLIDDYADDPAGSEPWNRALAVPAKDPDESDLEGLEGLGPKTKEELASRGIKSLWDLALLCQDDLDTATEGIRGVAPNDWVSQIKNDRDLVAEVTVPKFGAVYSHADLDNALRDAETHSLEPADFVTQTTEHPGSHATHVASIAAGNNGACADAWIVGVTIAMSNDDKGRRASLYDSTRLGQAIDFITSIGDAAGLPVAINISLGTNGHAHDGTSPINKWIESTLREQGRVICVAAGNSGKETATYDGDIGFMSGRIHASGRIPAKDLIIDLGWQVVGNGVVDVSENEMEIWYNPGDEFAVQIISPSGESTEWVRPGAFVENWRSKTHTFLSIYSERFIQANGANRISLFLSPKYKGTVVGVEPGRWTVRLRGERIRDGRFNAWIERDDPRPVGELGESDAWICPSYFSLDSNVDASSLNSLGCGQTVIAVANVEPRGDRIHRTSSQGPTRDGRQKPDIAAPGTDIAAARGFSGAEDQWMTMTGTSMASPFVTGVAAQMLIEQPSLTAGQILGIMRSTARPMPGSDYAWRDDAGFGVIDEAQCIDEVARVFSQVEAKPAEQ